MYTYTVYTVYIPYTVDGVVQFCVVCEEMYRIWVLSVVLDIVLVQAVVLYIISSEVREEIYRIWVLSVVLND